MTKLALVKTLHVACNEVLGEKVVSAMLTGRVSWSRILEIAIVKVFVYKNFTEETITALRTYQRGLTETGYFEYDPETGKML